jgi:hypothetical protein
MQLFTDYLVIGSGAASMAFCDTLLTELPNAKIIVVDKHSSPGGHWNDAYDFVQLHAPSLSYGVPSRQLEGNWLKSIVFDWKLPFTHRANKQEILTYYQDLMDQWIASGQVEYYPECVYNFEQKQGAEDDPATSGHQLHTFTTLDGSKTYQVQVAVKFVNGIVGECLVPSQNPPAFPVDASVRLFTPNDMYETTQNNSALDSNNNNSKNKYVILGCGKTAMDVIVYLQRQLRVIPDQILWIIPNDVWIMRRDGGMPLLWNQALVDHDLDVQEATLDLERRGILTRLDPSVQPTKFRYPSIGDDELEYLRQIPETNRIRRGRISAIRVLPIVDCNHLSNVSTNDDDKDNDCMCRVEFEKNSADALWLTQADHAFVDCTSPGPFNRKNENNLSPFPSEKEIRLNFLFSPPAPWSSSCIAALESRRRQGRLDWELGRRVLTSLHGSTSSNHNKIYSENDVLQALIPGYGLAASDDASATGQLALHAARPTLNLAGFMALYDKNPRQGYKWMCKNRLSLFFAPGFRCHVYENLIRIMKHPKSYGLSNEVVQSMSILAEKLQPLKGK